MQEYLLNPITLICLGTIFILVSVLFLYFKRNLSVLEKAQMDQARILQSFIANMEMTNMMQHRMSETNIPHQMNEHHTTSQEELIDVSDDEGSSDESDSDDFDNSSDESDSDKLYLYSILFFIFVKTFVLYIIICIFLVDFKFQIKNYNTYFFLIQ